MTVNPAQSLSAELRRKIYETIIAKLKDQKSDLKKKLYNDYDLTQIVIIAQIVEQFMFDAEFHTKYAYQFFCS